MKIKVLSSLAGEAFSYRRGDIVELNIFKEQVGTGWDVLVELVEDDAPPAVAPSKARKK